MPEWSRRQTLSALAGGLAVAFAGCRENASHDSPPPSYGQRVENYEVERVRNPDGSALFGRAGDLKEGVPGGYHLLTSTEDLTDLAFADVPEARTLREFSAATDFESGSVYLYASDVPECYELRLQRVEVDGDGPSAHFCRDLRPADAECAVDARDTVGFAIRFPFAGDEYRGTGSGMSSSCSRPRRPEPFDANVTLSTERDGR